MKLQQIMKLMDQIAPLRLAEAWDNVGLLLGDPTADISKVMTCLTLSSDVADEAVAEKADLVISHHPILFRPAKAIRADQPGTDIVWKLATRGVAVMSYHTAWDGAIDGANACIANALGLIGTGPIRSAAGPDCVKFVVFVSDDNLEFVRNAAFNAGAGQIGNYRECSFSTPGMGTLGKSVRVKMPPNTGLR
jgi:putative NIF3 family GTP cyclohydrolase 1 type 2